jgi:hypothetical protein
MVSEYLTHGRLHFRLVNTMKPGNYLLRVNGKYVKDTYQRTSGQGNNTYYVFQYHQINAYRGFDYVYELIPLKQLAQQAMEDRALPKIIQQITGDPFIQPFGCDAFIRNCVPWSRDITITNPDITLSSP